MKQKLALSCALIHKPAVLFLDEPTTGVDAVSRREFWEMLMNLRAQGLCIIVSTPYMDEAAMCDRVALMLHGRFLALDTPDAIIASYNRNLLTVRGERMPGLLRDLRMLSGVLSCHTFGDSHHVTVENDLDVKKLTRDLAYLGHRQIEIEQATPGIEDCFMLLAADGGDQE